MKTKIQFTLSMPNRGSWNGGWSGEGTLYAVVRDFKAITAAKILAHTSYYYRWYDGWGASVEVKAIDGAESRRIKKASRGFCGYEWMIDSIVEFGKIYADHQKPEKAPAVDSGAGKDAVSDNRSVAESVRAGESEPIGRSDWERASRGAKDSL